MIDEMQQCYMCSNQATSREHVPPKCLFPESKDCSGYDHRKGLMTVPSCDMHNSKKSKDDEFLMVSIAGIIGNNSIGYQHSNSKVDRAIRRTSHRLLEAAFKQRRRVTFQLKGNAFINVILGTPDYGRLMSCFEHIAFGLHLKHFCKKFYGRVRICMGHLHHTKKNASTFTQFIKERIQIELEGKARFGDNPAVFFYQFTDVDIHGIVSLKMCFYEGTEVFAAFMPDGVTLPFNLPMKLLEGGVKTYFTLGKKMFEFN